MNCRLTNAFRQIYPPRADDEMLDGFFGYVSRFGRHGPEDAFGSDEVLIGARAAREPAGAYAEAEEGAEGGAGEDPEDAFAFVVDPP